MTQKKAGKNKAGRTTRLAGLARTADKYDLYLRSVQSPDAEIDFVDAAFRTLRGRKAARLREDFCAAAATACEWVKRRPGNTSVGVDIDPVPLEWGRTHNFKQLRPGQRERVELRLGDVLDARSAGRDEFDIVLAMNFSYWFLKRRSALVGYFKLVRDSLVKDGVFFLDYMGGSDAHLEMRERRKIGRGKRAFTYVWDQQKFNPITADFRAAIHFTLSDGSRLHEAFVYEWRLWGVAEIRDALIDAGFARTVVYWEGDDGKGSGDGDFNPAEEGEACMGYIGYIAAVR